MLDKRKLAIGGAALAALVGSFAAGRFSAPRQVAEHIVTSERDTSLTWHAYVGRTVTVAKTDTRWRTVTQWRQDGSVEQRTEAVATSETKTTKDETESGGSETTAARTLDSERTPLQKAPDWLLSVRTGVDARLAPIYGGSVSRRVLGPLYAEAWAQWPLAGGLGLTAAF